MTPPLEIREAGLEDLDTLVGFQQAMALETEGKALDGERLRAGLEAVLRDPVRGTYLIARRDGAAVGCTMWTREWSDWRNGWFWWVQSVFVDAAARRTGVYRSLYQAVLDRADAAGGVCGVRLYVETENEIAQRTYEALGMEQAHYRMYEVDFVLGGKESAPRSSDPS